MKVFLTGATGFVGTEILRQLHRAGHSARIITRHPGSGKAHDASADLHAQVYAGDVLDPSTLAGKLEGVEAVIHLVGIISEYGSSTFERVHYQGTKNVLEAAREAGVARFLHMSALGTRPEASSRYHRSKWAAEEAVRQSGRQYTIFRPSIIYGPGDLFVNRIATAARYSPVLPILGDGKFRLQPVSVESVAQAFVRALTEPASIGQTYDLAGPAAFTFEALTDQILEVIGRRPVKAHTPLGLARGVATVLENVVPAVLRQAPPLNRDQLLMLQEDNVGNPRPAMERFDLQEPPFQEGIARYLTK